MATVFKHIYIGTHNNTSSCRYYFGFGTHTIKRIRACIGVALRVCEHFTQDVRITAHRQIDRMWSNFFFFLSSFRCFSEDEENGHNMAVCMRGQATKVGARFDFASKHFDASLSPNLSNHAEICYGICSTDSNKRDNESSVFGSTISSM